MELDKKVLEFLEKEHVGALTTLLENGLPHASSMHFAMSKDPLEFVFFTKELSRKCKHYEVGKKYPAAFVVGFDEKQMVEFQAEGNIDKVNAEMSKLGEAIFASKFNGAKLDNEHVVLKFTPTWWRYTEFKPKFTVISSEDPNKN